MTCTNPRREAEINDQLQRNHERLEEIANTEALSARVNGMATQGALDAERQRIIDDNDRLTDELEAIGGAITYNPVK